MSSTIYSQNSNKSMTSEYYTNLAPQWLQLFPDKLLSLNGIFALYKEEYKGFLQIGHLISLIENIW